MNSLWFVQLPAFKRPSHRKILWRRQFSQLTEKKAVKALKAVSARKLSSPSTPASPPSPPLSPVALENCQFLASHISVDGPTKKRHIDLTVSHHPQHRKLWKALHVWSWEKKSGTSGASGWSAGGHLYKRWSITQKWLNLTAVFRGWRPKRGKVVKVVFELKLPLLPLLPHSEWPVQKIAARFFRKFHLLIMKDFCPLPY